MLLAILCTLGLRQGAHRRRARKVAFRTDNEGQRIETDEDGGVTIIGGEGARLAAWLDAETFKVLCRSAS